MTTVHGRQVESVSTDLGGRKLTIESGLLAEQANGEVTVRYGDTMVLVAVNGDKEPKEGLDFFPLSVDYEERMYAAGKIPGGFIKREGRPTEAAILSARLTDRPIRPLFPKGYRAEVQVITTVLSADQENQPDILSIIGASAALSISPIPFDGPVGGVRVGLIDGQIVINPTSSDLERSQLNMVIAGTQDAIMMVEGEAGQVSEEKLLEGIAKGHEAIGKIVELQRELVAKIGKEKWPYTPPAKNEAVYEAVKNFIGDKLREAVTNPDKVMRVEGTDELKQSVLDHFAPKGDETPEFSRKEISETFDALLKAEVRGGILRDGTRPDGRTPTEVRPIWSEVGYLPRAHGSAIFTRGQTQVLSVTTLGSPAEEQRLDSINPEDRKHYIHHYNFPPFSVGEVRRMRGPGRREIGHGALAERALMAVLPSEEEFPYTMRVVSDVLSSNGSTSMASVCGSTLSLMDAGVPISAPVAGAAMGLVTDPETGAYTVLTDIQGIEDALGDMDFKVAGTAEGVTAIQMDIKVKGITQEIMRQALSQAHDARQHILGKMLETLSASRPELSKFAPRVTKIKIDTGKIGAVIGPGGKMIRALQDETGTKIDIADDGTVSIASSDPAATELAVQKILGLTTEAKVERGEIYTGKVVSIMPYGAFVELFPGRDGLVHISELSEDPAIRVNKVEDVVNLGDEITVMVTEVAPNGKVSLSRRAALTGQLPEPKPERGPRREGGDRGGPRRDDDRSRGPRRDGNRPSDSRRPSFDRNND
jgi:polyribonucleotide nucleotidyltransferase